MGEPKRKRKLVWRILRLFVGVVFVLVLGVSGLRGLVWLGDRVPMIEPTGPASEEGALTLRPIRFAQKDFWFYPPRVEAEEGRLRVPVRHDGSTEGEIELRFVRFAAQALPPGGGTPEDPAGGSPVVYLAGGPGGSGVLSASGDRFPFFMKLREVGDVIALDQRGTLSSDPYPICPTTWWYPLDRVSSPADLAAIHEPALRECWEHWSASLDPSVFNTVESAEDLEVLRIALGAERLNLVGISYGTHLALAYIRRHPERVAHAVLAGVEGPDHTYKRPAVVDGIVRDVDRTLEAEAGWKGFVEDIERGTARLAGEKPRVVIEDPANERDVEVALGPADLKLAVFYGLGEREDFKRAARRVRRIAGGDDKLLAGYVLRLRAGGSPSVMPLSMDCASGVSAERRERIRGEESGALIGDVINLKLTTTCPFWPVDDLGDDYRSPIVSDVPVLAVSGTLDPRTPPSNAEEVLSGFTRKHHLRIVGGGHDDDLLIATPEIVEAIVRFLRSGDPGRAEIVLPPL